MNNRKITSEFKPYSGLYEHEKAHHYVTEINGNWTDLTKCPQRVLEGHIQKKKEEKVCAMLLGVDDTVDFLSKKIEILEELRESRLQSDGPNRMSYFPRKE